ncbi:MAG: enoyl-CoA hydratase/isomerase family protein [Pseudobdellovibrionaceae bacterium]
MSFVLTDQRKPFHIFRLNRAEALNALNLDMIRALSHALEISYQDENCLGFIMGGEGRAFCAGGDIKAAYKLGMDHRKGASQINFAHMFFEEEYHLNKALFDYPKLSIAVMDGVTMGGGVGLAGPCRVRIATENTLWAMPETKIGFFPDVGGVYYLARASYPVGAYLALTGTALSHPQDLLDTGLATHYVPAGNISTLMSSLQSAASESEAVEMLNAIRRTGEGEGELTKLRALLERCFRFERLSDIVTALEKDKDPQAKVILAEMRERSPFSMAVALKNLQLAREGTFEEVIARDGRLANKMIERPDYYEGVRALLIDKDKNPRWQPDHIDKLVDADVNALFTL